jgi:hypothetical protein
MNTTVPGPGGDDRPGADDHVGGRRWRAVAGWSLRSWREAVYAQERLGALQRPWDQEGPLRWQRIVGGYRLAGAHLPEASED